MTRNLKALGLALVAVFAMSAVVASAAQAFTEVEVEGGGSATITAVTPSTQVFQTEIGKLRCSEVHGEAAVSNGASSVTAENISYANCAALFTFPVTVDFPSTCHYTFTIPANAVDLACSSGSVTVTVFEASDTEHKNSPVCTYHIFPQTGIPATYSNVEHESKMAGKITTSSAGVKTTREGPLCGSGEETALYTGNFVAAGESGGKAVGVTFK